MTESWADLRRPTPPSESRRGSNNSSTRVLLAYQLPLFLMHLMQVWGQTAMPRSTGKWGAYGNWSTCEAQGFILFGSQICGLLWDACLSTVFLLKVSYQWEESRVSCAEPGTLYAPLHLARARFFPNFLLTGQHIQRQYRNVQARKRSQ